MQSQDPDQQKNLLIAVALSMAILLGWQIFYAGPKMEEQQARERAKQEQTQTTTPRATTPDAATKLQPPVPMSEGAVPGAAAPPPLVKTRKQALAASPRLAIETPSLTGSIALKSGRIDDLVLVKYRETIDPTSPNVVLFSPANSPAPYFAEYGWVQQGGSPKKLPDRKTLWQADGDASLTPTNPVTLTWDNGEGLVFKRTLSIDDDYMIKVADAVENNSGETVTLIPYARIHRYGTPKIKGFYILHEGLIGVIGEKGLQEIDYTDAAEEGGTQTFKNATGGWLGFTDKYWASALVPSQTEPFRAQFSGHEPTSAADKASYQTDYLRQPVTIAPGQSQGVEAHLYAGAKKVDIIERYQADLKILNFDLMIDWGWFYFITKPLFYLLEAINSVVHNFGVSILILTVLVRLAFFPLANKQFASMAKMKKLQPQMEQLRERYKDDKMRQQQELMNLYKKEKVNPISGCLPILLQIPVFFALYKVLYVTIDMRQAPFFGWIQDLSAPDPTSVFNLFGLLPFAVPDFLHIGAWPLIMGITMWLQMQLNPQQPDPIQQQIFNWMPVLFTFLLASFPAGLVIYWAWSNTLSLMQQSYIMKKHGVEIHLLGNIERTFRPVASLSKQLMSAANERLPGSQASKAANDEKDDKTAKPAANGKQEPAAKTDAKKERP
jgi:YidC/Oxa1 family membrane protein insertase